MEKIIKIFRLSMVLMLLAWVPVQMGHAAHSHDEREASSVSAKTNSKRISGS